MVKKSTYILATLLASQAMFSTTFADQSQYSLYGNWPCNNGSNANLNVVTNETKLNKGNVSTLVPYWTATYRTLNGLGPLSQRRSIAVESTPVIADGVVYFVTSGGWLYAYKEKLSRQFKMNSPLNGQLLNGQYLMSITLVCPVE